MGPLMLAFQGTLEQMNVRPTLDHRGRDPSVHSRPNRRFTIRSTQHDPHTGERTPNRTLVRRMHIRREAA